MNPFRAQIRWLLILWMFVISGIAYLDRVNISIAGRSIEQEFHLDHIQHDAYIEKLKSIEEAVKKFGRL